MSTVINRSDSRGPEQLDEWNVTCPRRHTFAQSLRLPVRKHAQRQSRRQWAKADVGKSPKGSRVGVTDSLRPPVMLRSPLLHLECVGCCSWEAVAAPLHSREQQKSISDIILVSLLFASPADTRNFSAYSK